MTAQACLRIHIYGPDPSNEAAPIDQFHSANSALSIGLL